MHVTQVEEEKKSTYSGLDEITCEAVNSFSFKLPLHKVLAKDGAKQNIITVTKAGLNTIHFRDDSVYKVYFFEDLLKR